MSQGYWLIGMGNRHAASRTAVVLMFRNGRPPPRGWPDSVNRPSVVFSEIAKVVLAEPSGPRIVYNVLDSSRRLPGGVVRNSILVAIAVPLVLVSCGHANRPSATNDVDLQRDLKLAATGAMDVPSPRVNPANFDRLETMPQAELQPAMKLRRAPGPKAVASATGTLRGSAIPEPATTDNVPQVAGIAEAPAPLGPRDPVATVPHGATPMLGQGTPADGGKGHAGRGTGILGGIGPIIGVVIRGGGVDGDHCEPHGRGPTPGVYLPPPGGFGGTTRFPVIPRGGFPVNH
jgi:hypothetical protein